MSTPITDVVRPYGENGLVEIASSAHEFVEKLTALLARPVAPWLKTVDAHLATGSWDRTWSAMHRLIATEIADVPVSRTDAVPSVLLATAG